ncbi:topoisomerase II-associated protein PAT1 [Colletotrichum sublineola]|uniref:Putative topoisomerase II-associated protein PAT1 n=1 Tax=Colletotrichum sublineola TaxID=1173701 RepID=A0A066XND1_COLSU|nr:topoisomerase II-associated protein PAT1 [Colletotrichum sublineola]KDN67226.1 putative topoisomerase II-associated protein PAT1 [Colletotrichum sublineola]
MSFFGFDPSRPSHNTSAPGFSQAHDPFAGLSRGNTEDDDAVDFDDTYDGLGDQLEESGDAFNDDTFGGGGNENISSAPIGKDFDFFGQTAKVSDAIEEEQVRYSRQVPMAKPAPAPAPMQQQQQYQQQAQPSPNYYYQSQQAPRPVRTGYEKYQEAEPIPDLHVDASLWGMPSKKPPVPEPSPQPQAASASRKVMSLEEVEKAMREQATKRTAQPTLSESAPSAQGYPADYGYGRPEPVQQQSFHGVEHHQQRAGQAPQHTSHGQPVTILQRPQSITSKPTPPIQGTPSPLAQPPHSHAPPTQPTHILQNPNRLSGDAARIAEHGQPAHSHHQAHRSQGSMGRVPPVAQQQQQQQQHLAHLSEDEKAAYLDQETKRAKRNHKIWVLSKDNGLMTPQDKNFVTRIQLQQLVSATGNPIDQTNDDSLTEDFYYQVLSQIRGGQRQNPNQPLNNFAQTYLFQTGSRQGNMRRQGRAAENHVQRMEQQVQRAVEAAKNKPKNPQLVIAGSLGKISFSNAKTPKPLLNIKRTDSSGDANRPGNGKRHGDSNGLDRKAILRNIERVYNTIMKMEDHARYIPPPPTNGDDEEFHVKHQAWLETAQALNAQLWNDLKVHEPIGATTVHPFIAFLSFPKGKKAIPRVFRHISFEQRTTILTMIIIHLDQLDVVYGAQTTDGEVNLNAAMRESIELFSAAVMPSLFAYFNETELDIVTGVLGLISTKLNIDLIAKTRVGCSMLTLILSRAELLKQGGGGTPQLWAEWEQTFNLFFNKLEPTLHHIFPGSVNTGEDVVVWQLLAAVGVSANPEQQQRLVLAVKDRVLDTVAHAKTLPGAMATTRLATVNLFMHSIGLDVELLQ